VYFVATVNHEGGNQLVASFAGVLMCDGWQSPSRCRPRNHPRGNPLAAAGASIAGFIKHQDIVPGAVRGAEHLIGKLYLEGVSRARGEDTSEQKSRDTIDQIVAWIH
jgi:hypothetical protein